jgi:hypothetical protein
MNTRTIIKPLFAQWATAPREDRPRTMAISLPAEPFPIPPADPRDEVAASRIIRGGRQWQRDPVLRHADARKDRS